MYKEIRKQNKSEAETAYWKRYRELVQQDSDAVLRPGQYAILALPDGKSHEIIDSIFDPFYEDRNLANFYEWLFDWFDKEIEEEKPVKPKVETITKVVTK